MENQDLLNAELKAIPNLRNLGILPTQWVLWRAQAAHSRPCACPLCDPQFYGRASWWPVTDDPAIIAAASAAGLFTVDVPDGLAVRARPQ